MAVTRVVVGVGEDRCKRSGGPSTRMGNIVIESPSGALCDDFASISVGLREEHRGYLSASRHHWKQVENVVIQSR